MTTKPPSKRKKSRSSRSRAAEQVVSRNIAVTSIYRKLIGLAFVATIAAVISVVAAMSLAAKRVPPQYVPVLADGRLLPLIPLDRPNVNQAKIAEFSLKAIHALNTYDYINWIDQLNEAQVYFSPAGWAGYEKEIMSVDTLKAVEARRMVVSVRPMGDVEVVQEGKAPNGVYAWRVEVPVLIRYTAHTGAESGGNTQQGTVTLTISRVPTTVNERGLAIQLYKLALTQ